jgi:hypothetical protein
MQRNIDTLSDTLTFFQKAVPDPQDKNFTTQLGVHCEEFGEMLDELTPLDSDSLIFLRNLRVTVSVFSERLKNGSVRVKVEDEDRLLFLDALCDQIVTATGTGHMANMNMTGAMNEVNRSNLSKFDDAGEPIFDANLKVTKGPNYSKADLSPFI